MINVALIGIGNNASALVQGVEYYKNCNKIEDAPLLKYSKKLISEVSIKVGIDIDSRKVNTDLSKAIFSKPNCSKVLFIPPELNVPVYPGKILDGVNEKTEKYIDLVNDQGIETSKILKKEKIDVVVIMIPSGAQKAAAYYAREAISAGCCIVNGIATNIAKNVTLVDKIKKCQLTVIGDDIKSQVGATIIHKKLLELITEQGGKIESTYQLDWGGGMDFANLVNNRYDLGKRQSKTNALLPCFDDPNNALIKVTAADYIPFLNATKEALIKIKGSIFGRQIVDISLSLKVQDNFNAAGILLESIIITYLANKKGIYGSFNEGCAVLMKSPPVDISETEARKIIDNILD